MVHYAERLLFCYQMIIYHYTTKRKKKTREWRDFFFFFLRSKQNSGVKNPPVTNRAFLSRLSTQEIINSEKAMNQSTHVICTMCRKFATDFWSDAWLVDLILEVVFDQSDCRWASDIEGKSAQRAQETLYSLVWFEMFLLFLLLNDS